MYKLSDINLLIEVNGDSMVNETNKSIPNNSVLGFNTLKCQCVPKAGNVYLVVFSDGTLLVKVFKGFTHAGLVLSSLNTKYKDRIISLTNTPTFYKIGKIYKNTNYN